jgi:LPS O-antigen subunit length determinant protein (WzzB/FepE family)
LILLQDIYAASVAEKNAEKRIRNNIAALSPVIFEETLLAAKRAIAIGTGSIKKFLPYLFYLFGLSFFRIF